MSLTGWKWEGASVDYWVRKGYIAALDKYEHYDTVVDVVNGLLHKKGQSPITAPHPNPNQPTNKSAKLLLTLENRYLQAVGYEVHTVEPQIGYDDTLHFYLQCVEKVVGVAYQVTFNGYPFTVSLPAPNRHHNLPSIQDFPEALVDYASYNQGFITSLGRFLTREETKRLVAHNNQKLIQHKSIHSTQSFSEDFW